MDGGINLYAYTSNNPINAIDPEGLIWQYVAMGTTAVAAYYLSDPVLGEASRIQMLIYEARGEINEEMKKKCPDWERIRVLQEYIKYLESLINYYAGQGFGYATGTAEPGSNIPILPSRPNIIDLPVMP